MATHNDLGKQGEAIAANYLTGLGYELLEENWIHGKAELDLVAYFNGQLIFVEVKTRSSTAFGQPEDFVGQAKQKQLIRAATAYVELMGHQGEVRFDIVAVLFNTPNHYTINHIQDAFWPF